MTKLERVAIELHDHLWENVQVGAQLPSDEWPLHIGGDDRELTELIRLLNSLQKAIKASGHQRIKYCEEDRI